MVRRINILGLLILAVVIFTLPAAAGQFVLGDVTGSGEVELDDAVLVLRDVLKLAELTDEQRLAADIDYDGKVTVLDVILILRHIIGLPLVIDFSEKYMDNVTYRIEGDNLFIIWGEKPTGGYYISIEDIRIEDNELQVCYSLAFPAIGEPVIHVITYPEDSAKLPPGQFDDVRLSLVVKGVFYEDFEGHSLGDAPVGWTKPWSQDAEWRVVEKEGITGETTFQIADLSEASGYNTLTWDKVGVVDDAEVLGLFRTTSSSGTQLRLQLRTAGEPGQEQGYALDLRDNGLRVWHWRNGVASGVGSRMSGVDLPTDTWMWMRFRAEGNQLMGKAWPANQPEPDEWTIKREDDSITDPGGVGIGAYSITGTRYIDYVGVSTNGSTVPLPNFAPSFITEDFAGQPLNELPTGWTPVWSTNQDWMVVERQGPQMPVDGGTAAGDQKIADFGDSEGYRTLRWDKAGDITDGEILTRMKTTGTSGTQLRAKLRVAGEDGSEQGYSLDILSLFKLNLP